jgi:hypothetical protein
MDNAGLAPPIQALAPIADKYASEGLSRADVWALSGYVAAEVAQDVESFPFQWIGRKTCEEINGNNCGRHESGDRRRCTATEGPHRELCHPDAGTDGILEFFAREFGYDTRLSVAIMGAHSVGRMTRGNLGFDGPNGWDVTNGQLDNGYFIELMGRNDEPEEGAPDWEFTMLDNSGLGDIPDRGQWVHETNGRQVVMLNSDIALVRNLERGVNIRDGGRVTCPFKGESRCPVADETFQHVINYRSNRERFLEDFHEAFEIMITRGYRATGSCGNGEICTLEVDI